LGKVVTIYLNYFNDLGHLKINLFIEPLPEFKLFEMRVKPFLLFKLILNKNLFGDLIL